MTGNAEIQMEIIQMDSLKTLVRAYEEIASIRMKKTRDQVLRSRSYLGSINEIFEEVRLSYAHKLKSLARRKGQSGKLTFLAHNGKTIEMLLSANTGLYGEIVQSTFDKFIQAVRTTNSEVTIVGKHGLSMFLGVEPNRPYTYFELPDYGIDKQELDRIIRHVVQYEEIHVYYGQFVNVVKQVPQSLTVSAEIKLDEEEPIDHVSYIFEPTLDNILIFFETEIFASLFEQTVRESQLAKFASRVMAMDQADTNIQQKLGKLHLERMRVNHRLSNKKQINSLTSIRALGGSNV